MKRRLLIGIFIMIGWIIFFHKAKKNVYSDEYYKNTLNCDTCKDINAVDTPKKYHYPKKIYQNTEPDIPETDY